MSTIMENDNKVNNSTEVLSDVQTVTPVVQNENKITNITTGTTEIEPNNQIIVPKTPFKITLKGWCPVGIYTYEGTDSKNMDCSLCKTNLMDVCVSCVKKNSLKCVYATGECGHKFHYHCIESWLTSHTLCPIDGVKFLYSNTNLDNDSSWNQYIMKAKKKTQK